MIKERAERAISLEEKGGICPNREPTDAESWRRIETLTRVMDDLFVIPGTNIHVGLDELMGLIPGVGDAISGMVSIYIVQQAKRLGVPWRQRMVMMGHVGIDLLVGAIPIVGDLLDVTVKSNRRNAAIIRHHLERRGVLNEQ